MQRTILLFLVWMLCLISCAPRYNKFISGYSLDTKPGMPDYSNLYYWAAHPYKKDPSDSIPKPLVNRSVKDSTVDVFFLHPTTFTAKDTSWNADIEDAGINAKTDYSTILYQASVFNEWRVFSPRYRQANIGAYYTSDTLAAKKAFDLAYQDIKQSFQYYLDHYNRGRPVVIASHSQGSTHALRLLKEFFDNGQPLKNRLVVAYVLGMYIPGNYFSELKMCKDSFQTGCLVGWRTYKNGYEPEFVKKEKNSGLVTNPLTWTTSGEHASHDLNKGGVITEFNKLRPHITDAKIHDGILWINQPHIPGSIFLRMKNFHIGDINLFYVNIRENVRQRIGAFWKQ